MVKQNIITTAGGTCVRFGLFCWQDWCQQGAADRASWPRPPRQQCSEGAVFSLIGTHTTRGLEGGENLTKTTPITATHAFWSTAV